METNLRTETIHGPAHPTPGHTTTTPAARAYFHTDAQESAPGLMGLGQRSNRHHAPGLQAPAGLDPLSWPEGRSLTSHLRELARQNLVTAKERGAALNRVKRIERDVRDSIQNLNEHIARWPQDVQKQKFTWTDGDGKVHRNESLTKEEASERLAKLQQDQAARSEYVKALTDAKNLADQDFREACERLSKMLQQQHESMMAIINNMRG